jgi:CHAT domain-containing protein
MPTDEDSGLLKASDVLRLNLNADWIVLSACNTAAGGTDDADGLSVLAKAFFYAGARAILVSHWRVYSRSTAKLVTGTFEMLARNPSIGRAEGLRRAMTAMIDQARDEDGTAYWAHPMFWAPFVLIGEGGDEHELEAAEP